MNAEFLNSKVSDHLQCIPNEFKFIGLLLIAITNAKEKSRS